MRAVSDNPNLAEVSGINVENIVKATWVVEDFVQQQQEFF